MRDTPFLFSLCGLTGYAIVFFVPALLQLAATRASIRRWGSAGASTPHTTCLSRAPVVVAVLALGGAAFGFNAWVVLIQPVVGWMLWGEGGR